MIRRFALTHIPSRWLDRGERTFVSHVPLDASLAETQHAAYRATLRELGVTVDCLDGNAAYPDGVFIEDAAIVLDEVAILAAMGTESRRGEPRVVEAALRPFRTIARIEPPATLEGGDVLRVNRTLLVGLSGRTTARGIEALAGIAGQYGYRVESVAVRGCLHLKTACTALPDGRLVVNRNWLNTVALRSFALMDVPGSEPWSANLLLVGETVVLPAAHPLMARRVEKAGFGIRLVDISEFAKAEGGVTCLSILFDGTGSSATID